MIIQDFQNKKMTLYDLINGSDIQLIRFAIKKKPILMCTGLIYLGLNIVLNILPNQFSPIKNTSSKKKKKTPKK